MRGASGLTGKLNMGGGKFYEFAAATDAGENELLRG